MTKTFYFQLLGTRGSRPVLADEFIKFGGNTTSYKVWGEGMFPIYVDGGTGLFREGIRLSKDITHFTFLLTHSHWDHILAFPFFDPFYRATTHARFWGTSSFKETFEELFKHQFQTDAFPINYSELPASIHFKTIASGDRFVIPPPAFTKNALQISESGEYTVSAYQINHPGIDLGYRIEAHGKSVVILTDLAPIENNHLGHGMRQFDQKDEVRYYQGLADFCQDADVVLHDTHFNEQNIKGKESWGHSTEIMAVNLALRSRVKRLILGHHAPEDTDAEILKKYDSARRFAEPRGLEILVPQEDEILLI